MQNEIIINAERGETRVAIIERANFSELHIERQKDQSVVGSVVKGRVTRVLPGMQAAFVDIGLDKAAFLYAGDYFANGFSDEDEDSDAPSKPQRRGRGRNSRQIPKIDSLLHEGQEIVVQIAKAPIGSKGARIMSHISIPGRHLVLTPWSRRVGVSRRIDSDRERRRLREVVERLRPKNLGFIIRTAGDGVRDADLEADIRYLSTVWESIAEKTQQIQAPAVLHSEPDLPLRMIRDFAGAATKRIVVDSPDSYDAIRTFVDKYVADPRPRIEHYTGQEPIFDAFGLEAQIQSNLGRKVFLKSGGSIVVDKGEALTAIDVNTGRYVGKRDLEETVFKTNLEAVKEVVNQLRFRNIGGLIIIDLIDMESADHREKVYRALREALRVDKSRTNILKISELGLVEMTRKRTRESLLETLCEPCSYCEGRGYVLSSESVAYRVVREIRKDLPRFCGRRIALSVAPQVAEELLRGHPPILHELGEELGREIEVRARPGLHQEQFEVVALDEGPPVDISLRWLETPEERAERESAEAREKRAERAKSRKRGIDEETDEDEPEKGEEPGVAASEREEGPAGPGGDAEEAAEAETASESESKEREATAAEADATVEATPKDDPGELEPEDAVAATAPAEAATGSETVASAEPARTRRTGEERAPDVPTGIDRDAAVPPPSDAAEVHPLPEGSASSAPLEAVAQRGPDAPGMPEAVDVAAESRILLRSSSEPGGPGGPGDRDGEQER